MITVECAGQSARMDRYTDRWRHATERVAHVVSSRVQPIKCAMGGRVLWGVTVQSQRARLCPVSVILLFYSIAGMHTVLTTLVLTT